ncbi:uncharacterized protein LOC141609169 [Silene latifolia]|uniref:uncharacterized protein LOC141609169 n=1 Tax=Silene latifolia TaxID=37657 RepID=UPI003D77B868
MLEDIRTMLMKRLMTKKKEMEEEGSPICPNIQKKLEKEKEKAALCEALPSSPTMYQVKDGIDEVKVNLVEKTCTCRKWDVTGVPCYHAVAAIFDQHLVAEDFVHEMYRKDTYLRAYNYSIGPCPGERHWPKVDAPLIPPPIKVGPGRPRKKRRRDPHEDPKRSGKLTKHGIEMTCSICKSKEHNKRTCPKKGTYVLEADTGPKRGRGRPRKVSNTPDSTRDQALGEPTAQPSRLGRTGRVISRGGGRGSSRGAGRGGSRGSGRSGARKRLPQGMGILFDGEGNVFTNNLNSSGPMSIDQPASTQGSTQVSSNHI